LPLLPLRYELMLIFRCAEITFASYAAMMISALSLMRHAAATPLRR